MALQAGRSRAGLAAVFLVRLATVLLFPRLAREAAAARIGPPG